MPARPAASVLVVGYLSLDTIVANGIAHAGVPGGGALYAALGAARAGGQVGLVAACGADFPPTVLADLARAGVDVGGVVRRAHATRRTRIEYGLAGRRRSPHYRSPAWRAATRALAPPSPARRGRPRVVVLTAMPVATLQRWIRWARSRRVRVVVDTSEFFAARARAALLRLASRVDLFAPSREETRLLLPGLDDDAALRLLGRRCRCVVQKRGADGLALVSPRHPRGLRAAAPSGRPRDPTGAGDAVVGALAVGLARGMSDRGLLTLARRVAAAAVRGLGPAGLGLVWLPVAGAVAAVHPRQA